MIAFTIPGGKHAKSIMLLNGMTEAQKFEHHSFNFTDTKTVVVKNELYVFKNGHPVTAYKIARHNFTSTDHLVTNL